MATEDTISEPNLEKMNENLRRVEELSQRLIAALGARKPVNPPLNAPSAELYTKASKAYLTQMFQDPVKVFESQLKFWSESVRHFAHAQELMLKPGAADASDETAKGDSAAPKDRRFMHPLWETNPFFSYVKEQYLLSAQAIEDAVGQVEDLDPKEQQRLKYFTSQIVDMMCPTNFLGTNPEALEKALATDGESLVRGLENLVADVEANKGEVVVRLADESAFSLGENIATSPGQVIYRNRMMELIQYEAATETVFETPLIIFPPWINKFYILDLKAQNSLIKWLTEQGHTVFIVSWVNPDTSYADTGLEDYITDGYLRAIEEVKSVTKQDKVNAVGYCIAGTTLSMVLSLLKKRGDKSVKSATFFTALTDFSDQGEFTPFLQDDFIDGIEGEVSENGILRSYIMARTFSFLRSRDLIYTPAVRSYMMGEAPPAFDLLYWNGDGANLPGKMTVEYLRGLCQENKFADGGIALMGETLHVRDVTVPLFAVTCETDHIAPWTNCYRGVQQMRARDKTFVVSESGHIAGIVNPPTKDKYGHYLNADLKLGTEDWLKTAEFHKGSWWPRWGDWLKNRSGKQVDARPLGDSKHPPLAPAPGTYVVKKATEGYPEA